MLRYCKIHSALKSKINYAEIADSMKSMQNISTKSKNEKMSSGDFNPRDKRLLYNWTASCLAVTQSDDKRKPRKNQYFCFIGITPLPPPFQDTSTTNQK